MMTVEGLKLRSSEIFNFKFLILNSRRGGFTLIETVIVMVIAVILAAVVAVRWSPFDSIKLYNATRKVAADIRYSQKLAISSQTRAAILFNANGYSVYQDYASLIPAPSSGDGCSTGASNYFVVAFDQPRCSEYSNVTITSPATNPIAFDSRGTPVNSAGTTIVLQTVTVTYNGSRPITIDAVTGRVNY
jgi:prepilin-type N-terminal cleavage/methylation domain-containing protein